MILQIKIEKLKKNFEKGFSLEIDQTCFSSSETSCIFGSNGAGKSTFFEIMTGNLEPDSGQVLFNANPMAMNNFSLKQNIGYLPQEAHLPKWITAIELMNYMARLHGLQDPDSRVQELLTYWDCTSFKKRPLNLCSHGMQKRVGLALASLHNPDYLILDEPFSGLDLLHTYALESYIQGRKKAGKMTLISTHIAPYAATLCNVAFLLKEGSISKIEEWSDFSFEQRISYVKKSFLGDSLKLRL